MPTHPRRVYISFKGDRGFMDLTFTSCVAHLFQPQVKSFLESGMSVHQTGKSAAIRVEVDPFIVSEPDDLVLSKVRAAFAASVKLIHFYRENGEALSRAAVTSIPPL